MDNEDFYGRISLAEFARNLGQKHASILPRGNVKMRERLGIFNLIDEVPEGAEKYEIRTHINHWDEEVIYLLAEDGKTYFVDLENRQLVRAIAPRDLFDDSFCPDCSPDPEAA